METDNLLLTLLINKTIEATKYKTLLQVLEGGITFEEEPNKKDKDLMAKNIIDTVISVMYD